MARPPHARERVLDAYVRLLRDDGERAATMEAVAAAAGVSKGGLLYHFGSKEALAEALIERFEGLVAEHLEAMSASPEGPARYYVRSSVLTDTPLDVCYAAVQRLAQTAHGPAGEALERVHRAWLELIKDEIADDIAAAAIMLIGEGLYYHAALPGPGSSSILATPMEELLAQVDRLRLPH